MDVNDIIYLITYFILYSFAGWVLESVSKTIAQRKFVNSGFLHGIFCPIYGFGALIMLLCLDFLKEKPILLFLAAFVILSIWEYMVGVFLEKVFKTKYWDYSHLKFNFQGRVCLKNSFYWGILGVAFICFLHPLVESYIQRIPMNILFFSVTLIGISMIVDLITSIIAVVKLDSALNTLNELSDNIKEKIEELKGIKALAKQKSEAMEKATIENMENVIKELKTAQAKLKIRVYRHANRLKKAFPSMKSESMAKFLNQKIDLKKLKENSKKNKE